jgi:NAD(P)-dependent dehydrogenase (short-subunit alcohol dehydrogenase family)
VINTVEAAFPHLGAGASIVCTGSMAAMMPGAATGSPGTAGYSYAKRSVARFVHDLASDAARYVTGQQLKVDAGALLTVTPSGAPA